MRNQPHDSLFRRIFSDLEHARSLLKSFLPASLVQAVNFSTLEPHSNRFVSKKLRKSESDLIFSAKFCDSDQKLFLYFLIEHQSSPDEWMPLRLLLYIGEVYDWCRRQNPKAKKLPFVFPIVFYHGRRKWNAPNNFRELVDIPESLQDTIQAFVPDFSYRLEDLSLCSDQALWQLQLTACARAVLGVLRHVFDKDLAAKIPEVLGDLTPWLATIKGFEEFSVVLRYVIDTSESVKLTDLEEWRKKLSPDATRVIMTLAEQLRAEGEKRGHAKGLAGGLRRGFPKARPRGLRKQSSTSLSPVVLISPTKLVEQFFSCQDTSILDRWLRRALTVRVSNDVFRDS